MSLEQWSPITFCVTVIFLAFSTLNLLSDNKNNYNFAWYDLKVKNVLNLAACNTNTNVNLYIAWTVVCIAWVRCILIQFKWAGKSSLRYNMTDCRLHRIYIRFSLPHTAWYSDKSAVKKTDMHNYLTFFISILMIFISTLNVVLTPGGIWLHSNSKSIKQFKKWDTF